MKTGNNNSVICEVLENRTMMSVTHIAHKAAPVVTTVIPVMADPAISDPSVSYKNFANLPLFSNAGPSVNDINQGDLGDCYFLSTLSAIAKTDPALIRKDIINNNDGTYTVDFTQGKTIKPICVNADLPVFSDGQLAYAGLGAGRSMWVAIMEKAFADFRTNAKSYDSISGGWMNEVFSDLGIKSTSTLNAASATAMAKLMAAGLKAGDAATFGTGDTIHDGAPLIADHAYEIDAVTTATVRLRNPWGIDGAGNDGHDDGYVTMTIKQAFENFSGMVVAKV